MLVIRKLIACQELYFYKFLKNKVGNLEVKKQRSTFALSGGGYFFEFLHPVGFQVLAYLEAFSFHLIITRYRIGPVFYFLFCTTKITILFVIQKYLGKYFRENIAFLNLLNLVQLLEY